MKMEQIEYDLAIFSDLGVGPPRIVSSKDDRFVIRMVRGGEELELQFHEMGMGKVAERSLHDEVERTHSSYRALLASRRFGNLRKWADSQQVLLNNLTEDNNNKLRVVGRLPEAEDDVEPEQLDEILVDQPIGPGDVRVMLIDGPAGIGKTRFIEELALHRAKHFLRHQRPLVLHVESRGRVLTFIQDLIAFSLQRMRLPVTFDQVPILVRHSLVTLAIDGFDELGDPGGYSHAWGQLNELINQIRGGGTIILAGRDTFIGSERIRRDIKSLNDSDTVEALSLQLPLPEDARNWLLGHGWTADDFESANELFEIGSYSLRPFFLAQLANREVASTVKDKAAGTPLPFLVDLMINREIGKFGDAIDEVMTVGQRSEFVRRFLREVARFMADDQTESIDEIALEWIVDMVAPEELGAEILNLLRNRAGVVAFLENDSARNHRRFAHSQLFNHFLGEETIDIVGDKEIPKYLRRNILAADFLAAFGDLVMHIIQANQTPRVMRFFKSAVMLTEAYASHDRGPRNLGALLISMLPVVEYLDEISSLAALHIDEASIRDAIAAPIVLDNVTINQLDIRGSDIRPITFKECTIVTLIANDSTWLSASFPTPSLIRFETQGLQQTVFAPEEIVTLINSRKEHVMSGDDSNGLLSEGEYHPILKLLGRACRNRSYWIKQSDDDVIASRLLRDPNWPDLIDLLRKHDLVREEQKPAGGQAATFLHIKRPMDILSRKADDGQIDRFYQSVKELIQSQ